jgi:hypothetical protein
MAAPSRKAEYLAKAREADAQAATAADAETRACWEQVAQNYRALARRYQEIEKSGAAIRWPAGKDAKDARRF